LREASPAARADDRFGVRILDENVEEIDFGAVIFP